MNQKHANKRQNGLIKISKTWFFRSGLFNSILLDNPNYKINLDEMDTFQLSYVEKT